MLKLQPLLAKWAATHQNLDTCMSVSDLLLITGYSLQYMQVVYIKTELNHKHVKESESIHNKIKFPGKTHSPKHTLTQDLQHSDS